MYIEDSSIDIVDVITDNIIQHTHGHTHIKREASYRYKYRCRCNSNNNNNITSKYQLAGCVVKYKGLLTRCSRGRCRCRYGAE